MRTLALIILLCLPCLGEDRPHTSGRTYPARVAEITDGDTCKLDIDLGYGVSINRVAIRLVGVFAPEHNEKGGPEATAKLQELLPVGDVVLLRPVMSMVGREQMTFTRYVGRIWNGKTDVCEVMTKFTESLKP